MSCRCCLRPLSAGAEPLWGGSRPLAAMLGACLGRRLVRAPGLPDQLCRRCARRLPRAWQFLHLCHKSELRLREFHPPEPEPEPELQPRSISELGDSSSEPEPEFEAGPPSDVDDPLPKTRIHERKVSDYIGDNKYHEQQNMPSERVNEVADDNVKYRCKICAKEFKRMTDLKVHFRIHSGEKPYSCEHCPMRFRQSGTLAEHTRSHTGEKPYSCDVCSKVFRSRSSFWRHQRVHTKERPHSCDVCGRSFAHSSSLKHHQTVHTDERPFSCDACGKTVKSKLALKQHMIVHSNSIYVCEVCGKKFTMKSSMQKHIKNMHSEGSGRCPYCKKDSSDLKQHLLIHGDDMTYQCHLCEKSFKQKNNLSFHLTLHKNAEKYKCEVGGCGQVFPKKNMLEFHFHKIHSNETPHICQYCSKGYIRISDLSRHLNVVHSEFLKRD